MPSQLRFNAEQRKKILRHRYASESLRLAIPDQFGVADGIVLCLFGEDGAERQIRLRDYDAGVWHAFVPGIKAGQAYGYRVAGPWDPGRFVEICERARREPASPLARMALETQRAEWQLLFDYCARVESNAL